MYKSCPLFVQTTKIELSIPRTVSQYRSIQCSYLQTFLFEWGGGGGGGKGEGGVIINWEL